MKKVLVFMLCFLAVFAIVSCKNEPTPEPTPDPPAPEWKAGDLVVSPGEGATYDQDGKFQFKMAVEYSGGEAIEFRMRCSDAVTKLDVREAGNGDLVFGSVIIDGSTEKDSDGWYIISIPADSVTPVADPCYGLGLTARLPNEARANCFVAIRNMKIGDEAIDFSAYIGEEDALVGSFYGVPDNLNIEIKQ